MPGGAQQSLAARWSTSMSGPFNQMAPWIAVRKKLARPSGKYNIEELLRVYYPNGIPLDSFEQQIVQGLLVQIMMATRGTFSLVLVRHAYSKDTYAATIGGTASHRRVRFEALRDSRRARTRRHAWRISSISR